MTANSSWETHRVEINLCSLKLHARKFIEILQLFVAAAAAARCRTRWMFLFFASYQFTLASLLLSLAFYSVGLAPSWPQGKCA